MMKEEINTTLMLLEKHYPAEANPYANEFVKNKIAPVSDEIISLFEREGLTFEQCYRILDFTYSALKYKSQKVNL